MRARKKKWTQNELDTNERLVTPHDINKGRWREYFGSDNEIHAEIGCGMGRFIIQSTALFPCVNFVALEREKHVIVSGMRASREFETKPAFVMCDADALLDVFAPGELARIYINFCDPWPRLKWRKRRLTHRNFLEKYKTLLRPGSGVFFKTDDMPLFDFSLAEFTDCGWRLENVTRDLHGDGVSAGNLVMTEYEEKFYLQGMPIFRCEAYI
ncbi:MAG: tRNA (guanosine(46)-N7)-methyltransferase TrmB [Firmicutes bacterium]|nr:tRNA (guanosine(46)-N7)-methyltransferase TrmB [Bacillota bacterium]